jgi:hypothetical protein
MQDDNHHDDQDHEDHELSVEMERQSVILYKILELFITAIKSEDLELHDGFDLLKIAAAVL